MDLFKIGVQGLKNWYIYVFALKLSFHFLSYEHKCIDPLIKSIEIFLWHQFR